MWLTPLEEPATSLKFSRVSECHSRQMVQEREKKSVHKHFLIRKSSLVCDYFSCANFYTRQIACARILLSYKTITTCEPYLVLLLGVCRKRQNVQLFWIETELPHHTSSNHCGFFGWASEGYVQMTIVWLLIILYYDIN